ncbi:N-acetylmuramoyl-L-alanine amidase [Streptomyces sp. TRM75563]|uniref:peptidoglycan recognition protein family protein n=1 Tax=Streptomyces sp. TRM75563 TaxID=2817418 RepID=UPI001F6097AD|nr:N-acetylmuramoyl-L-alanine amidase [Streptomyces sp. TRM75563]MCI4045142.1 N-acetylmuramoyl-L-alanine amidase [Streptomyces sp. TRM75563]
MAWYSGAKKMELQPESDSQQAIRPTQLIVHSIVANWTARRTYEFWRDSTNLESHFGIGYGAGDIAQYIGTETRADANAGANRRSDGTGAISVETASNSTASDPWNASQVEELIKLGVWAHQRHGVPLRICRTPSDPGFGYHSMFPQWSTSGTACPGPARIRQFREVVFPGIVARATGKTNPPKEADVPLSTDDVKKIWKTDGILPSPSTAAKGNDFWTADSYVRDIHARVRAVQASLDATNATVRTLAEALAARDEAVDVDALIARITAAIEGVTVRLETES